MNLFNTQNPPIHSSKQNKKRLSQDQVRILETNFNSNKKLEPDRKLLLARELGIPPRQIAIWYQNRRAKWKNQSLELDYSALQRRLDTALTEKRRLEKEVERLRIELHESAELIHAYKQAQAQAQDPVLGVDGFFFV